ncbi:hypothetical protein BGW36DRAFT_422526 [Talaromyces proteolyticus]|uniref:Uncharacterized protein n=1 Tax=Talaromyces proteolyticus TaxID=1131652 RepID=A0AAD4Q757_9EURO|nr:uncharacterized protein BGW36DRAFT_422526 [Talaromyces proteolyticus]KAH8706002.1 hypothetical protein BGW36DRAFT_422526 [Talaromyces proteolyticus]
MMYTKYLTTLMRQELMDWRARGLKLSGVFGDYLWSLGFQLYSMSKGVSRVSGLSFRAPFYAQPFVADFISKAMKPRSSI